MNLPEAITKRIEAELGALSIRAIALTVEAEHLREENARLREQVEMMLAHRNGAEHPAP